MRVAMGNWLRSGSHFGENMGETVSEVVLFKGGQYGPIGYYLILLEPSGWVKASADDRFHPIPTFGPGKMTLENYKNSFWHGPHTPSDDAPGEQPVFEARVPLPYPDEHWGETPAYQYHQMKRSRLSWRYLLMTDEERERQKPEAPKPPEEPREQEIPVEGFPRLEWIKSLSLGSDPKFDLDNPSPDQYLPILRNVRIFLDSGGWLMTTGVTTAPASLLSGESGLRFHRTGNPLRPYGKEHTKILHMTSPYMRERHRGMRVIFSSPFPENEQKPATEPGKALVHAVSLYAMYVSDDRGGIPCPHTCRRRSICRARQAEAESRTAASKSPAT